VDSVSNKSLRENDSDDSVKSRTIGEKIESTKWVSFKVNNEMFAIEALEALEVQKYSEITPVPGTKPYICGLINLRGKVITVIDMRTLFRLESKPVDDKTIIILVELNENEVVGFVVDDVSEIMDVALKNIADSPKISGGDSKNEFLKGVTYVNKKMIIVLDIKKIFAYLTPTIDI
jgi:purine-binding chemotaxis protein CheW